MKQQDKGFIYSVLMVVFHIYLFESSTKHTWYVYLIFLAGVTLNLLLALHYSKKDSEEVAKLPKILELKETIEEALNTDGAHHKQWYLEQIAKKLGIKLSNGHDEGIAP